MMKTTNRQIALGVGLILVGVFLLLNQLDLLNLPWYIFTWQFFLIGLGVFLIAAKNNWEAGIILMTIGAGFLIPRVWDITFREMFQYWPVLLILLGVGTLIRTLPLLTKNSSDTQNDTNNG